MTPKDDTIPTDDLVETIQDIAESALPARTKEFTAEDIDLIVHGLAAQGITAPEPKAISWMDSDPEQLRGALARRSENRKSVMTWIMNNLVEGVDFGRIHVVKNCDQQKRHKNCADPGHFSKPSLWKPGAEKIVGMLNMRATWPELVQHISDAMHPDAKNVALRCVILDQAGNEVSEGVGARGLEREYFDLNKALKMAKKSSLIDAVLNAAGLSEVFTQDAEDHDDPSSPDSLLDDHGQKILLDTAQSYFGDLAHTVLESLARKKFKFSDGNWTRIPAWRLQDAIRSLEEKYQDEEAEREASS